MFAKLQNEPVAQPADSAFWHIRLDRSICADVQTALNYEWLVTNGLGGYASSSLVGATTRGYHGLLVAAVRPPVERVVMVTGIDEEITLTDGTVLKLGTHEYQGGVLDPQGYHYLEAFELEGDIPCFRYRLTDELLLEKRIWMEYGENRTYVQYRLHGAKQGDNALALTLVPFCLSRDYHGVTRGSEDWHFIVDSQQNRCRIRAYDGAPVFHLVAGPSAFFSPTGLWYWHVYHRRERERGLPDLEDVYQPGIFRLSLGADEPVSLVLAAGEQSLGEFGGEQHEAAVSAALRRQQQRIQRVLDTAACVAEQDPVRARLTLAADQCIVSRPAAQGTEASRTVIAGYPWFTDWGRDTMIALPGLFLCTGRYEEARALLRAFLAYVQDGLIPNRFPDYDATPEYNTIDATLWLFYALDRYLKETDDVALLQEVYPILVDIIEHHVKGTRYNIGMDAEDGLLRGSEQGVQLTWMDAKIEEWVVTPRRGKPVEVNALWYFALRAMERWTQQLGGESTPYQQRSELVKLHFARRFWYADGGYLYDVVDVDGVANQNDPALRPNQLFAAALAPDLLAREQIESLFQQVTQHLLTPAGLRTLSPHDPNYHNHFNGNRWQRDSAYHQGTVWQWLIGPYIDVHWLLYRDVRAIRELLQPLIEQLTLMGLGSISEVAEPEPPFELAGCFAQAWSVAEVLRCWRLVQAEQNQE